MINQTSMSFPVIPSPYLPPLPEENKNSTYTLVLDLDETLVHYVNNVNLINVVFRWRVINQTGGPKFFRRNVKIL